MVVSALLFLAFAVMDSALLGHKASHHGSAGHRWWSCVVRKGLQPTAQTVRSANDNCNPTVHHKIMNQVGSHNPHE